MRGDLVGVNTAIFSRSGGSIGIGFAIPSNMVRVFIAAAKNGGRFERPYIGAGFSTVTPDIASAIGLDRPAGALTENVYPNGPAEKAGLRPGDVVETLNGFPIGDPDALGYRLATSGIGQSAKLGVLRDGNRIAVDLPLEAAPETPPRDARVLDGETPFGGATIANLSPRLADELDMPQTGNGVVVTEVRPGSFAARLGLRPKDLILDLNGAEVETSGDLERLAAQADGGWDFEIERDGKRLRQRIR